MQMLVSCDWGLSTFRIRLLAGSSVPEMMAESAGTRGIASLATRSPMEFSAVLRDAIQDLFHQARETPRPVPVCLSGMITSSLGWKELPYARLPFPLDGSGALIGEDVLVCSYGSHPLYFISGISSRDDAMRGEECEVVGIFSAAGDRQPRDEAVAILPGTHSKAIKIHGGQITDFRTFLTGEMFDILCRHSVLRHSVETDAEVETDESFEMGVQRSLEYGLLGSLFSVRARDLLDRVSPRRGRNYLSGLLIGDELKATLASNPTPVPVVLGGTPSLQRPYRRALELLGAGTRVVPIPESISSLAAALGHWHILGERPRFH
jgi:2-dehydro-3-deoxygalactonokinase